MNGVKPELQKLFDVEYFDIRDASRVEDFVRDRQPEVVYHLAAQALVRPSYNTPVETLAVNVMGTVHLLEAVRRCESVRAVVNVTSDKCYENREWDWGYRENEAMGGHDPYSASKGCAEIVTSAYRKSFLQHQGVGVATARAGNVIGGCDWSQDRLLPDIARSILSDSPVFVRNPDAIRPWQHVLEAIAGYLALSVKLLESPEAYSEGWNFGPVENDAVRVLEIAQLVVGHWKKGLIEVHRDRNAVHEAKYLKLDSSKARNRLGWQSMLTIQQRLEWTTDWYRAWDSDGDWWRQVDRQIRVYQGLIEKCELNHEYSSQAQPASLVKPSVAA